MSDVPTTGFELELLLPEGQGRMDLLHHLASTLDLCVEPFPFFSKVPVPRVDPKGRTPDQVAAATIALIQDVARHHEAKVQSISKDMRFFFLMHRAGRLVDAEGALRLTVVHDNTLAGGERVCELITPPLAEPELAGWVEILERVGEIDGVTRPESAALHVHVDARALDRAGPLTRLVELYLHLEPALRRLCTSPSGLRRAASLPPELLGALRALDEDAGPEAIAIALAPHVPSRGFGLNLRNLVDRAPDKLTIELKLAAATLDPERVLGLRALLLGLLSLALAEDATWPEASPEAIVSDLGLPSVLLEPRRR